MVGEVGAGNQVDESLSVKRRRHKVVCGFNNGRMENLEVKNLIGGRPIYQCSLPQQLSSEPRGKDGFDENRATDKCVLWWGCRE